MYTILIVTLAFTAQRSYCAEQGHEAYSVTEEGQVGMFYGLGSSFRVSQLLSLVPRRVRTMAACVQRVGDGHEMREMRDEMNYIVNVLQKHPATGPVMLEMEMIYTDTVQVLTAIPTVVMKPLSELSFDDLIILRDAAFNLLALPIRIERFRSSLANMFLNSDLYDRDTASELGRHFVAQIKIAADIGSAVLRCRDTELAAIAQTATSISTLATTQAYDLTTVAAPSNSAVFANA